MRKQCISYGNSTDRHTQYSSDENERPTKETKRLMGPRGPPFLRRGLLAIFLFSALFLGPIGRRLHCDGFIWVFLRRLATIVGQIGPERGQVRL